MTTAAYYVFTIFNLVRLPTSASLVLLLRSVSLSSFTLNVASGNCSRRTPFAEERYGRSGVFLDSPSYTFCTNSLFVTRGGAVPPCLLIASRVAFFAHPSFPSLQEISLRLKPRARKLAVSRTLTEASAWTSPAHQGVSALSSAF